MIIEILWSLSRRNPNTEHAEITENAERQKTRFPK